ncbi:MAG TPA: hypothetical protein VF761_13970 [Gemmatimonadaceae bacterium]
MPRQLPRIALVIAASLAVASCTSRDCCVTESPAVYGRVYGVVETAAHVPAPDVFVQPEGSTAVPTDEHGAYVVDITVHGTPGTSVRLTVTARRLTPGGGQVDSTRVSAQVPVFATKPVTDSARVDLTLP